MRQGWKAPNPKDIHQPFSIAAYADSELDLSLPSEKVFVPPVTLPTISTSPPAGQQPEDNPRRGFRNAFRALVQPVRTLQARKDRDNRRHELVGDPTEHGTVLDQAESDVYQNWISGLRETRAGMERYEGPIADISGTHELGGSVVPIQVNEFAAELPG
jgi:hypothetical protein